MLSQQEPFPAVVVDRRWNLLQANKGAVAMVEFLVGPLKPGSAINLADALVGPDVLRPHLTNWTEASTSSCAASRRMPRSTARRRPAPSCSGC